MNGTPLPKLSYVLLSHNRENYIRSAVENALAQEYDGELEYIISDDCSTDRTYDIIRETVAAYRGNRRVVVTQTPKNLHLAGNTNHALQFVTGDWIIRADDDDFSSLDRCSIIGKTILAHPDATAVAVGIRTFTTPEEKTIQQLCSQPTPTGAEEITNIFQGSQAVPGFSRYPLAHQAWSMKIFRIFGELPREGYYIDDLTCYFRALMLGVHVSLPHTYCLYVRKDGNNMSTGNSGLTRGYRHIITYERFLVKYYAMTAPIIEVQINEFERYMHQHISPEQQPAVEVYLNELRQEVSQRYSHSLRWKYTTWHRFREFLSGAHKDAFCLLRCLPLPVYAAIVGSYRRLAGK